MAAAFPSACGKTNLAMLQPTIPGWKAETIGDDIAWMRFGDDGRLYAVNPEAGFFGVAPGTSRNTNQNALATLATNTVFTNTALTADGDVWWEGLTKDGARGPDQLEGRSRTIRPPASPPPTRTPASPRRRRQCPTIAPEWEDPQGRADRRHPVRRPPRLGRAAGDRGLRLGARRLHGLDRGLAKARPRPRTPSATLRRDPFAMLPFCGYNMGDYFAHWLALGEKADAAKLPRHLFRQLVPQGRGRQVRLAGLRRQRPRAEVDLRAARRRRPRPSTRRSAASRRATRWTCRA